MAEKWVELMVTYDAVEAEMVKALLESAGIEVVLRSDKVSPYPVNVGKMGEVRLFVKEASKKEAEEMIKNISDDNA